MGLAGKLRQRWLGPTLGILIGLLLLTHGRAVAEGTISITERAQKAPVVLDGRVLFEVNTLPTIPAADRAELANRTLQELLDQTSPDQEIPVTQLIRNQLITLRLGDEHFLTVTDEDLISGMSEQDQANRWISRLRSGIVQARTERTQGYRWEAGWRLFAGLGGMTALSFFLRWQRRRSRRRRNKRLGLNQFWPETGFFLMQVTGWTALLAWATGLYPELRRGRFDALQFLQNTFSSDLINLGGQSYSAIDIGRFIVFIIAVWIAVRWVTRIFRSRILLGMKVSPETQDTITLLFQIILISLCLLVLMQIIGINVSSLAIPLSVLGVGVGFGLQNIANNFVSGVIIKLERPIQVGDFVNVDDLTGTIERIGIRSTEIKTIDHIAIIIPNSEFIDRKVVNWSHGIPVSRLHIPLGVAYGSSVRRVRSAILGAAAKHPKVLRFPKPQLWFDGFGDSSLNFDLLVWIGEPRIQGHIRSDLYYLIEDSLRHHHIEIPFPQRDIHLRSGSLSSLSEASSPPPSGSPATDGDADAMDWAEILECSDQPTASEITSLVGEMKGPDGVDIRDRRHGIQSFPRCFVGQDAVAWFMRTQRASESEAVRLGQILVDRCIIHHVTDEHDFHNEYLFYRFFSDEQSERDADHPKS